MSEGLLRKGLNVIAIDESPEMLAQARSKFGVEQRISLKLGEAYRIPLEDSAVDYAFANMVLHHLEEPLSMLREVGRILRPGGKVVITDLDEHDYEFLKVEQHDRWKGFSWAIVRSWLCQAGFEKISVTGLHEECCATSRSGKNARVSIFAALGTKPTHKTIK